MRALLAAVLGSLVLLTAPTGAATAPSPLPPPQVVRFAVGLANIRHDEPATQRRADIRELTDLVFGIDDLHWIAAGAEIDNPVSRQAWHDLLRPAQRFGARTEDPVSLSHGWQILGHAVHVRTHGYPGVDPARTTVALRAVDRETGIKVAELATHRDHLAFGPGRDARSRAGWFAHWRADRALVLRLRHAGYVVIVTEDGNHVRPIRYGAHQIVAARSGLMQITVLAPLGPRGPPGEHLAVHVGRVHARTGYTDHPLIAVPITVSVTKG